jgi:hypothetical protein
LSRLEKNNESLFETESTDCSRSAVFSSSVTMAQLITADIAGSVLDPQGLPVAAVRVEAVNKRTGQRFGTQTNNLGE